MQYAMQLMTWRGSDVVYREQHYPVSHTTGRPNHVTSYLCRWAAAAAAARHTTTTWFPSQQWQIRRIRAAWERWQWWWWWWWWHAIITDWQTPRVTIIVCHSYVDWHMLLMQLLTSELNLASSCSVRRCSMHNVVSTVLINLSLNNCIVIAWWADYTGDTCGQLYSICSSECRRGVF